MKDHSQRVPAPVVEAADTVPHLHAVCAARTLHRTMMYREYHRIPLAELAHLDPGLAAWPLFGQHEFTAGKIGAGLR